MTLPADYSGGVPVRPEYLRHTNIDGFCVAGIVEPLIAQ